MSDKYPGFFTAIFGGRKVKEPEPVKPKKKPKKKVTELEPEHNPIDDLKKQIESLKQDKFNIKGQSGKLESEEDE
jgi:hypothetical protein